MVMAPLLQVLSCVYGKIVACRRRQLQGQGRTQLPVPVISVGNITVGGTGKTEAVAALCEWLKTAGWKPGILSRGYGRRRPNTLVVVSRGSGPEVAASRAGDEPFGLASRLAGVAVVVAKDRRQSGDLAVRELGCTILVLDDGFQRRDQLARTVDIVLLDAADPFGQEALLPAGRLREPLAGLREAGMLILTRTDQYPPSPAMLARLLELAPGIPLFLAIHRPVGLESLADHSRHPLTLLKGRRVLAVAGIGRPQAFIHAVQSLGSIVVGERFFPDHYPYRPADLQRILNQAQQLRADVVTTTKDAVRLCWPASSPINAWAVRVEFDVQAQAGKTWIQVIQDHLPKPAARG